MVIKLSQEKWRWNVVDINTSGVVEKFVRLINLKFLLKLKEPPSECFQLLKEVYAINDL